ncbi:MAG TPA: 4-phosphoerythronate dehydrogenase PdxB [Bacteroidales bacterium]
MKFIIDDKIPYIKGALEPFGEVVYLPGAKTTPKDVKDADVLLTRTRTICDEKLLSGSTVKFIATATIGYDHIDTSYCDAQGIKWVNAAGCNSGSVEQYIASALFVLAKQKGFSLKDKTIGIVGVGHVGSKVARVCKLFGMKVLLNDPPRARKEGPERFSSLGEIIQKADVITFHVPLIMKGEDSTYHLADSSFFEKLKLNPIILNSSRGEIIETNALKDAYKKNQLSGMVIDCWENEPNIDLELLGMADLATPHIAGYSKDGKANGTSMSVQAISRFFNLGIDNWQADHIDNPDQTTIILDGLNLSEEEILSKVVLATYDIRTDDAVLRSNPALFEKLREDYPVRREYPVYNLLTRNIKEKTLDKLELLEFKI